MVTVVGVLEVVASAVWVHQRHCRRYRFYCLLWVTTRGKEWFPCFLLYLGRGIYSPRRYHSYRNSTSSRTRNTPEGTMSSRSDSSRTSRKCSNRRPPRCGKVSKKSSST